MGAALSKGGGGHSKHHPNHRDIPIYPCSSKRERERDR